MSYTTGELLTAFASTCTGATAAPNAIVSTITWPLLTHPSKPVTLWSVLSLSNGRPASFLFSVIEKCSR